MMRSLLLRVVALTLLTTLSACTLQPVSLVREVALITSDASNNYKPLHVDIVLIEKAEWAEKLKTVKIEDWFEQRERIMKDLGIAQGKLKSYTLLPASEVNFTIDLGKTQQFAVFANYSHTKNKPGNIYEGSTITGILFNKQSYRLQL